MDFLSPNEYHSSPPPPNSPAFPSPPLRWTPVKFPSRAAHVNCPVLEGLLSLSAPVHYLSPPFHSTPRRDRVPNPSPRPEPTSRLPSNPINSTSTIGPRFSSHEAYACIHPRPPATRILRVRETVALGLRAYQSAAWAIGYVLEA
jgi:hypothetical protein